MFGHRQYVPNRHTKWSLQYPLLLCIPTPALCLFIFFIVPVQHLCWSNLRITETLLCECFRGLNECQMPTFDMHLRVLLGLVGVMDE